MQAIADVPLSVCAAEAPVPSIPACRRRSKSSGSSRCSKSAVVICRRSANRMMPISSSGAAASCRLCAASQAARSLPVSDARLAVARGGGTAAVAKACGVSFESISSALPKMRLLTLRDKPRAVRSSMFISGCKSSTRSTPASIRIVSASLAARSWSHSLSGCGSMVRSVPQFGGDNKHCAQFLRSIDASLGWGGR